MANTGQGTPGDISFELDPEAAKKFVEVLEKEGVIKAGFVIHESNNVNVSVKKQDKGGTTSGQGQYGKP